MRRVLQLNTTWEPMRFVSSLKAFYLLNKGRAKTVTNMNGNLSLWDDLIFKSEKQEFVIPATIVLVGKRVKRISAPPKFRKKVLFNRDNWRCSYCNVKLTYSTATIDHVVPSSKGGSTSWKNCVAACQKCNRKKSNKSLKEAGMQLRFTPGKPSALDFWDISRCRRWHKDWDLFVQPTKN